MRLMLLITAILAKSSFALYCFKGFSKTSEPISFFDIVGPCIGDKKCGSQQVSVSGQKFAVRKCYPSKNCGKTFKKEEFVEHFSKSQRTVVNNHLKKTDLLSSKVECCEEDLCNGIDSTKQTIFILFLFSKFLFTLLLD